jgi:hypothetical protein
MFIRLTAAQIYLQVIEKVSQFIKVKFHPLVTLHFVELLMCLKDPDHFKNFNIQKE